MSQRCLVTYRNQVIENDEVFDCIYDENSDYETLLKYWVCEEHGWRMGPLKIWVRCDDALEKKFLLDMEKASISIEEVSYIFYLEERPGMKS